MDDDEPTSPSEATLSRDRIFQLRLRIERAARQHPIDVPALKAQLSGEMNRLRRLTKSISPHASDNGC
jgi:hypothetical protein